MQQFASHGPREGGSGAAQAAVGTLLIKHLPEAIPHDTLARLFSHYGALSVRTCTAGRLRNCAFVDFKDEVSASQAQHHLNGLRFLGKVLSVEKAGKSTADHKKHFNEARQVRESLPAKPLLNNVSLTRDLSEDSKARVVPASEPIAERLGVDYPFPPHLEYAYPPPDGSILTNIVNSLIAVPRFYTQVLHLMNKMNLPAPFRMALPTPPLPPSAPTVPPPPPSILDVARRQEDLSSDESEMDSSGEVLPLLLNWDWQEVDEKACLSGASGLAKHKRKRTKLESIVGPGVDKDVTHEAVGLKPATLTPKEIPIIKKKNPVVQFKIGFKDNHREQKDDAMVEDPVETVKKSISCAPYATPKELKGGKLPPEELLSLPMFKNYTPGNPSAVLYMKNLAKDVVADDFHYIFGSIFGSVDASKSSLNVKLMQEGRMKGQSFVTFPSVELASHALSLVNGFVFKGKPVIVQFGRNSGAAKAQTEKSTA